MHINMDSRSRAAFIFSLLKLCPSLAGTMMNVGIKPTQLTMEDQLLLQYYECRFGNCDLNSFLIFIKSLLIEIYCYTRIYGLPAMFFIKMTLLPRFMESMAVHFEKLQYDKIDESHRIKNFKSFEEFYHDLKRIYILVHKNYYDPELLALVALPGDIDPTEATIVGLHNLIYPRYVADKKNIITSIIISLTGHETYCRYSYLHCAQQTIKWKINIVKQIQNIEYRKIGLLLVKYLIKKYCILQEMKHMIPIDVSCYSSEHMIECAMNVFLQDNNCVPYIEHRHMLDNYWRSRCIDTTHK
jgi:hypothetical protein